MTAVQQFWMVPKRSLLTSDQYPVVVPHDPQDELAVGMMMMTGASRPPIDEVSVSLLTIQAGDILDAVTNPIVLEDTHYVVPTVLTLQSSILKDIYNSYTAEEDTHYVSPTILTATSGVMATVVVIQSDSEDVHYIAPTVISIESGTRS